MQISIFKNLHICNHREFYFPILAPSVHGWVWASFRHDSGWILQASNLATKWSEAQSWSDVMVLQWAWIAWPFKGSYLFCNHHQQIKQSASEGCVGCCFLFHCWVILCFVHWTIGFAAFLKAYCHFLYCNLVCYALDEVRFKVNRLVPIDDSCKCSCKLLRSIFGGFFLRA